MDLDTRSSSARSSRRSTPRAPHQAAPRAMTATRSPRPARAASEAAGLDLVTFQDHPYQPRFHETWTLLRLVAGRRSASGCAQRHQRPDGSRPSSPGPPRVSTCCRTGGSSTLGAGYFWDAMESMGVDRLAPGASVDALEEAIDIIRGIWAASQRTPLRTNGILHHVKASTAARTRAQHPDLGGRWQAPHARPHRPARRRLGHPGGNSGLADLSTAGRIVDAAAIRAGRDPREIRRIANVSGRFAARDGGFLDGPPDQWVEDLLPVVVDHGVGTVILASDDPDTIETFAGEVVPPSAKRSTPSGPSVAPRPGPSRAASSGSNATSALSTTPSRPPWYLTQSSPATSPTPGSGPTTCAVGIPDSCSSHAIRGRRGRAVGPDPARPLVGAQWRSRHQRTLHEPWWRHHRPCPPARDRGHRPVHPTRQDRARCPLGSGRGGSGPARLGLDVRGLRRSRGRWSRHGRRYWLPRAVAGPDHRPAACRRDGPRRRVPGPRERGRASRPLLGACGAGFMLGIGLRVRGR